MADNEIRIIVEAEVKKAIDGLKKTEKETEKVGKTSDKASKGVDNLNTSAKKSDSVFGKLKASYLAAAAALAGLVMGIGKALTAYGVQEKAEKTLAAAMKQSGTFTEAAFKRNLAYAQSLQKITTFGDEAILGVQRSLANFGIQGKQMEELTKVTLDLAAAKGMDLASAGDLVAKSVGSSNNALSRYGIEIEGAAGSTDRAAAAVANITKLFGGAAAAEAQTFSGKIQQMKNAFGDLLENVGGRLAPVFGVVADAMSAWMTPARTSTEITNDLIKANERYEKALSEVNDQLDINTKNFEKNNRVKAIKEEVNVIREVLNLNKEYGETSRQNEIFQRMSLEGIRDFSKANRERNKEAFDQLESLDAQLKALEGMSREARITTTHVNQYGVTIERSRTVEEARTRLAEQYMRTSLKITETESLFNGVALENLAIIEDTANVLLATNNSTLIRANLDRNLLRLATERYLELKKTAELEKDSGNQGIKNYTKTFEAIEKYTEALARAKMAERERQAAELEAAGMSAEALAIRLSILEEQKEAELKILNELFDERKALYEKEITEGTRRRSDLTKLETNRDDEIAALDEMFAMREKSLQKGLKAEEKNWEEHFNNIANTAKDIFSAIGDLTGALFNRQIQQLEDAKQRALDTANDAKMQLAMIDDQEKMNEELALQQEIDRAKIAGNERLAAEKELQLNKMKFTEEAAAREAEIQKQYDDQIKQAKTRQARFDKANSIAQAVISTGLAIVRTLAGTTGGPIARAAAAATVGGLGAAQIAAISAQPIPRFLSGIDYVPRDRMPALLDEGERVLTKEENTNFNNNFGGNIVIQGVTSPDQFASQLSDYLKSRGAVNQV
jgi:hypothetical protein